MKMKSCLVLVNTLEPQNSSEKGKLKKKKHNKATRVCRPQTSCENLYKQHIGKSRGPPVPF